MKLIITAGPTREFIDPVRFISNRSSGKMGYSIADEAVSRGYEVILISGPVNILPPPKVNLIEVIDAESMFKAVKENIIYCDVLVMAAAVCDWKPIKKFKNKLKKNGKGLTLKLVPTKDILSELKNKKEKKIFIGFAAETENIIENAKKKLIEKNLDMIVANDVLSPDSGFEVDTNRAWLIFSNGVIKDLGLLSKKMLAREILTSIEILYLKKQTVF